MGLYLMERAEIWSSGGGVQSSAIAALIYQGELSPDLSVIIDTEREMSTTWEYLDKYVLPALDSVGCKLHRVRKSKYATVDLFSKKGDVLMPMFTNLSGDVGKLPTYCSNEWKQRPMRRWASEQGVTKANVWIGYTIDELRRVTQPIGKWQNRYPLIERRMTRGDCIALVKSIGWPEPPKSRCWDCPNQSEHEWKDEKENHPVDWNHSLQMDRYLRSKDDSLYFTSECKPLDECDFDDGMDLFTGRCDSGMCFV